MISFQENQESHKKEVNDSFASIKRVKVCVNPMATHMLQQCHDQQNGADPE